MRIFFDTEFLEDGKTIELISIGLVRQDGEQLYLENSEFDRSTMTPWLKEHVWPHLHGVDAECSATKRTIGGAVQAFVGERPEFWAYFADYDWVVLCQLYGRMIDLPKGWPMYCRDLKQLMDIRRFQLAESDKQAPLAQHNALNDALWCRQIYEKMQEVF